MMFVKGIQAAGAVAAWIGAALADGKITVAEMADLVSQLGQIFGFPVSFDFEPDLGLNNIGVSIDGET